MRRSPSPLPVSFCRRTPPPPPPSSTFLLISFHFSFLDISSHSLLCLLISSYLFSLNRSHFLLFVSYFSLCLFISSYFFSFLLRVLYLALFASQPSEPTVTIELKGFAGLAERFKYHYWIRYNQFAIMDAFGERPANQAEYWLQKTWTPRSTHDRYHV